MMRIKSKGIISMYYRDPDLNKINNSADENSVWTLVSSGDLNKTNKSVTVDRVKARYVKIEIPSGNIDGELNCITEFEVYMTVLLPV